MRWLVRLFLLLVLAAPVALAALLVLALDDKPLVTAKAALTPAHIERATRLLSHNDPRRMRPGVLRTVTLSQEDLEIACNYLIARYASGAARIILQEGTGSVRATFTLPSNPLGRYANIDAELVQTEHLPRVARLRIGRLPVPAFVGNWLVEERFARLQASADFGAAADTVKHVRVSDGLLSIVFVWSEAAEGQLKAALVPADERVRWQVYQARLVELTNQPGLSREVPLKVLLVPLLQLASQRAGTNGSQAIAENRSALIVLAFYVNGKGLAALVPAARDWPAPAPRRVTLAGRTDFPEHFAISAALAATAGSPLADAVGLYKEVDDARRGSGFSFGDIAADRAGTRFGELAVTTPDGVARLSGILARGLRETDLVPEARDLPEFMAEQEFKRRYGGIGQPAYLKMVAEIERRIAALPLYR